MATAEVKERRALVLIVGVLLPCRSVVGAELAVGCRAVHDDVPDVDEGFGSAGPQAKHQEEDDRTHSCCL